MSTDFEALLARVLGVHMYKVAETSDLRPGCTCGWVADRLWESVVVFDAHVAAAQVAALTEAGLIGGESETEYGVRWPIASDPSGFNYKVRHDLDEARTSVRIHPVWHGVVVSRTVTRSPWVPVEEVAGDE